MGLSLNCSRLKRVMVTFIWRCLVSPQPIIQNNRPLPFLTLQPETLTRGAETIAGKIENSAVSRSVLAALSLHFTPHQI